MRLSLTGYSHLAAEVLRMAQRLCEGRVVFVLEGGYHPDALRYGASNVARLLVGDQPDDSQSEPAKHRPDPDVADLIASIKKLHRI
jgi:acetoin utilization deacetylase AcuC-like enzyme